MPAYRDNLFSAKIELAKFLARSGRADEAAILSRDAYDLLEKMLMKSQDEVADSDRWVQFVDMARRLRDAGDLHAAEKILRSAQELAKKQLPASAGEPNYRRRLAEIHAALGTVLQRAGKFREAAADFREVLTIFEQLAAEFPADIDYQYRQARAANYLGIALRMQPTEVQAAANLHQKAIALCNNLATNFPDRQRYQHELARSHYSLGIAQRVSGRWGEAEAAFRTALAASEGLIELPTNNGFPPQIPSIQNELAWLLATCPDEKQRNADQAVEWARTAVEGDPSASYRNTLGVAHYRAGNWSACIQALDESVKLRGGGDSFDWFFLAMAHQQLEDTEEARRWFDQAIEWMDKNAPRNSELLRFRAEAAALLGVQEKKSQPTENNPLTVPTTTDN